MPTDQTFPGIEAHQDRGDVLTIFLVAGEPSGDALGGELMAAVTANSSRPIRFVGVGGPAMQSKGLVSLFAMSDVAVMGPLAILSRLPLIVSRVYQTVNAAVSEQPDVFVIIDSPEFTHPIAKRLRRRSSEVPILNYVSPSVWAWRPGRAARMRPYIDHLMALLPFEPAVHERLDGPACTYVGHPLIEHLDRIKNSDPLELANRLQIGAGERVLVVLPGSRASEVDRLMQPFGDALSILAREEQYPPHVIAPVVPGLRATVERHAAKWPVKPHIIEDEQDKWAAFKLADAALVASGTVTLELALAGTPMVAAYKVDPIAAPFLRRMITAPTIVLANLVLGENVFPEYIQEECTGARLANALKELLNKGPELERQLAGLQRVSGLMALPSGTPSAAAAKIVLRYANKGREG